MRCTHVTSQLGHAYAEVLFVKKLAYSGGDDWVFYTGWVSSLTYKLHTISHLKKHWA